MCSKAMQKTLLSLVSLIFLGSACTSRKQDLPKADFGFFKSPEASEACVSTNLSQWSLSGEFLDKLLRCASNKSVDGPSSLDHSLQWLDALGPVKLQKLVDFLLTEDTNATDHAGRYPYLLAFSTLLDRGLLAGQKQGLELTQERLGDLQGFLLALPPERSKTLLTQWSQSGELNRLLQELGFFLNALADNSLEVLVTEGLQGQTLREPFFALGREVLGQDNLMLALDKSLKAQSTGVLSSAERLKLFQQWRQASLPSQANAYLSSQTTSAGPTPAAHLADFTASLNDTEIKGISEFLLSFWNAYRSQEKYAQISLNTRLVDSLEHALDQQKNPALWSLALLSDLRSLPVQELDEISAALERLISDVEGARSSWDSTLDTLRAKIGSQKLSDALAQKIATGGAIASCPGLSAPVLVDETLDAKRFVTVLQWWSQIQPACQNLSPLAALSKDVLEVEISEDCASSTSSKPCLPQSKLARPQQAQAWQKIAAEDFAMTSRLLELGFAEQRRWLSYDPYSLRQQGLAYDAMRLDQFDALWQKWKATSASSLKDLAAFDLSLSKDPQYQSLLAPDFCEQILNLQIERLGSLAGQFYDLVPEVDCDRSLTQRATRTFAGLYNRGPWESALREKMSPLEWLKSHPPQNPKLAAAFAEHPEWLSRILGRLHSTESTFRNPAFATLGNEELTPFVSLGSGLNNLINIEVRSDSRSPSSFQSQTLAQAEVLQPLQAIARFDSTSASSANAWALWDWQLASSALTSKDLPPDLMKAYDEWVDKELIPALADPSTWSPMIQKQAPAWAQLPTGISREFFTVKDYSPEEARILVLYYLRHYTKLPQSLPNDIRLSSQPNPSPGSTSFSNPVRGFMNAAYMSSPGSDYLLFAKMVPDSLRKGSSLEELQAQLLPPFEQYQAEGGFFPYAKQSLIRDVAKFKAESLKPNVRLFSTLNLLSYTRSGLNFFPQPLIGIGAQSCQASATEKVTCAVELTEADTALAYKAYQAFLSQQIAQIFCPLIAGEDLGESKLWQERLGLTLNKAETCSAYSSLASLPEDKLRFPVWFSKRILEDSFTLGREAQLKEGLAQIPSQLRFYKLASQGLNQKELVSRWLRESTGVWDEANASSQSRRQRLAINFWAGSPSLLNSYLDTLRLSLGQEEWKQALVSFGERTADGQDGDGLRKALKRFVELQKALRSSQNATVSDLLLQFVDEVSSQPEEKEVLSRLLADYRQLETYDFLGNELPLAVLGLFEDRFDWQKPGFQLTQFLAQQQTLQAWSRASALFSPSELQAFLDKIQAASQALGPLADRQDLFKRFLDEVIGLGTLVSVSDERVLASSWDDALKAWRNTDFSFAFEEQWLQLLAGWDKSLSLLDGSTGPSAAESTESLLPAFLKHGSALLVAHQATGSLNEDLFWPRLLQSFLDTMEQEPLGSRALAGFLASDALGFQSGAIWNRLLLEESPRYRLSEALTVMGNVPQELWQGMLTEATELLGRMQKPLAFLKDRIEWKEDPGSNAFQKALEQMFALSRNPELRDSQLEVLNLWLNNDSEDAQTASDRP